MTDPTQYTRRSFVYRRLAAAGASFRIVAGCAVAESFPGGAAVGGLGLADLSPLPRLGFKGPNALATLAAAGLAIPDANNRAGRLPDGAVVARLGDGEALILGDLATNGDTLSALADLPGDGCYPVPRRDSHAWFLLVGAEAADCLAKLCGVDLRPREFCDGGIAQTTLASISGVLIRDDRGNRPAFHILADGASAGYLWDCLIDAMAEFNGGPIGLGEIPARA